MKNLKIGKRIGLAFGAILVLFLIVSTISVVSLRQNNGKFVDFFNNGHQVAVQALEMRRDIQSAAKNVGYATMPPNSIPRPTIRNKINNNHPFILISSILIAVMN